MPRPKDNEHCAVCLEEVTPQCCAADLTDDPLETRTHLQFMWDRRIITHCRGMDEHQIETHMRDYALNRMLAPFRDNLRKKKGERASRTYESRNVKGSNIIAKKCPVMKGNLRCLRNAGHEADGLSHKF